MNAHSKSSSGSGSNFTKEQNAILKQVWSLESKHRSLLNSSLLFVTELQNFVDHTTSEEYPGTYEDYFTTGGRRYNISYIYTSGQYLEDLSYGKPGTPIAFQLRVCTDKNFYYCVARLFDKKWTWESMKRSGAIEV